MCICIYIYICMYVYIYICISIYLTLPKVFPEASPPFITPILPHLSISCLHHLRTPVADPHLRVHLDGSLTLDVTHVLQPELAHLPAELQHLLLLHVQPLGQPVRQGLQ